jgi:hypothetical protein
MAVSDNFNRTDSADLGANWTLVHGATSPQVLSNQAKGQQAAYHGSLYNAVSFNATQTAQIESVSNQYHGPAVRMSSGPNWYGYFTHGEIHKSVAGSVSTIGTEPTFTGGDTARIDISGTTIETFKNAASNGTLTDSSLSSGSAGLMFYDSVSICDNWTATGEDSGATPAPAAGALALTGQGTSLGLTFNMPDEA